MLKIQEYLLTHSFGELHLEHGIYESIRGHKFSLNYSQIEARDDDPLAKECRGLILAWEDPTNIPVDVLNSPVGKTIVLAHPMDRFFNLGQGAADILDWKNPQYLRILTKVDGTLAILYFDVFKNEWCVATRSVPNADIPLEVLGFEKVTFRGLFEKCLLEGHGLTFEQFTQFLCKESTYCFEITSPANRIVVKYDDFKLTLLAARRNSGMEYLPYYLSDETGIPFPKEFQFNSPTEIHEFLKDKSPLEVEGFVVREDLVDGNNFKRVKIKSTAYVAYNRIKGQLDSELRVSSYRGALALVLSGALDDVLPMLPEYQAKIIIDIKVKYLWFCRDVDALWLRIVNVLENNPPEDDKARMKMIALEVQKTQIWQAPIFAFARSRAKNCNEFVQSTTKNGKYPHNILDSIIQRF